MISLPEIQQWKQDDMDELSRHFNDLADSRGNTMDAIQRSADNLSWAGAGNDGKTLTIAEHAAVAAKHAQLLRATAAVAKAGGQALYGQQQGILATVQDAQSAEFEVSDDLSVTDPNDPMGFRAGIAAGIEADLKTQATAFSGQQMTTASEITSSAAGLGTQPTGNVKCRDQGGGNMTCHEVLPDGSLFTWNEPGGPDYSGSWPDAATITPPGQGVQAMGGGFRQGGGDDETPLPPIADRSTIGPGGGRTPLEPDHGGPAMSPNWPRSIEHGPDDGLCVGDEYERKLEGLLTSSAGAGLAIGTAEAQGPLAIATVPGALIALDHAADDYNACIERNLP